MWFITKMYTIKNKAYNERKYQGSKGSGETGEITNLVLSLDTFFNYIVCYLSLLVYELTFAIKTLNFN